MIKAFDHVEETKQQAEEITTAEVAFLKEHTDLF